MLIGDPNDNYPPGVTGYEPEINGDLDFELDDDEDFTDDQFDDD